LSYLSVTVSRDCQQAGGEAEAEASEAAWAVCDTVVQALRRAAQAFDGEAEAKLQRLNCIMWVTS
jgi:hypothetical protein